MCFICEEALKHGPKVGLEVIGAAIKGGRKPEHFKKTLDKLLGTEEPEVDAESDDAFERAYRDGRR